MGILVNIGDSLNLPEPVIVFHRNPGKVRKVLQDAKIPCFVMGYRPWLFVKHVNVTVKRGHGLNAVAVLRKAGFDAWPRMTATLLGKV